MIKPSLTALVSAFSRAFHAENNEVTIFKDSLARQLLTDEEYQSIAVNMSKSITFFRPEFVGSEEAALRYIVDNQLAPTPLGRAAFTEQVLKTAVQLGATQYLIMASGYDTFAYRQPDWGQRLHIFELDHPATASDKQQRINALQWVTPSNLHCIPVNFSKADWVKCLHADPFFDSSQVSVCSLLGITYYLPKGSLQQLLSTLASIMPGGSSIIFDYPDENTFTPQAGQRAQRQLMMAAHAGEPMQASYSYEELASVLEEAGLLVCQHLTPPEITEQLFGAYNDSNPKHRITAFDNVNYCMAVVRHHPEDAPRS